MDKLEFLKAISDMNSLEITYEKDNEIFAFENGREFLLDPAKKNVIKEYSASLENNCSYILLVNESYSFALINGFDFQITFGPFIIKDSLFYNFKLSTDTKRINHSFKSYDADFIVKFASFICNFFDIPNQNPSNIFGKNFVDHKDILNTAALTDKRIIEMITEGNAHKSFDQVARLEECVKNGNLEMILDVFTENKTIFEGNVEAPDIKTAKALCISGLTIVTRAAIKGGVNYELAYKLSDTYLAKIIDAASLGEIDKLYYQIITQFTKLSYDFRHFSEEKHETEGYHVSMAKKYIGENIQSNITVVEIAEELNISPNYLSMIFKKETGQTITKYISITKITIAKKMLNYSGYSIANIALSLGYASQSHFGKKFKEETGMTPKQYLSNIGADEGNEFKMITRKKDSSV